MTLKGGTNHYNVKFLSGYGFSVKVKDSKIVLKNCFDPFSEPQTEEWYPKNMPYEKILLIWVKFLFFQPHVQNCKHQKILLVSY